jgi:small subunit ribosomal protein S14
MHILTRNQRLKFARYELKLKTIKSVIKNRNLKSSLRWYFSIKTSKKRKQTSKVRIKNRCVLSGRARSLYRFAKLSRLFLRDNQFIGSIVGLRKSYW